MVSVHLNKRSKRSTSPYNHLSCSSLLSERKQLMTSQAPLHFSFFPLPSSHKRPDEKKRSALTFFFSPRCPHQHGGHLLRLKLSWKDRNEFFKKEKENGDFSYFSHKKTQSLMWWLMAFCSSRLNELVAVGHRGKINGCIGTERLNGEAGNSDRRVHPWVTKHWVKPCSTLCSTMTVISKGCYLAPITVEKPGLGSLMMLLDRSPPQPIPPQTLIL